MPLRMIPVREQRSAWHGHFWTVYPHVRALVAPPPGGAAWSGSVLDERFGEIPLVGEWSDRPEAETAVVLVHGLGGVSHHDAVLHAPAVGAGGAVIGVDQP